MSFPSEVFPLSEGLEPIRTELQSRWVRDFLLTSAPIHLEHLLSPSLPVNSIQVKTRAWNVLPTSKLPSGGETSIASDGLITPVFTSDRDVYGVGVERAQTCNTGGIFRTGSDGSTFTVNARFALSPSRQTLTCVLDLPKDDAIIVAVTRLRSFTDVSQYTYYLRKMALLEESNAHEGALSEASITSCLFLAHEDHQKSSCVKCGAHWSMSCQCRMSLDRPLHPFDISHFKKNIRPFINNFEPVRKTVFYAFGKGQNWTCDGARAILKPVEDLSIVNNLAAWSISEYLSTLKGMKELTLCDKGSEEQEFTESTDYSQPGRSSDETADRDSYTSLQEEIENSLIGIEIGNILDDIAQNRQDVDLLEVEGNGTQDMPLESHCMISDTSVALSLPMEAEYVTDPDNGAASSHSGQATACGREGDIARSRSNGHEERPSSNMQTDSDGAAQPRYDINREAVNCGRERRKLERDALKSKLQKEHEQVQLLRKRENELRQKNIMLRSQVKKAGIQFTYSAGFGS